MSQPRRPMRAESEKILSARLVALTLALAFTSVELPASAGETGILVAPATPTEKDWATFRSLRNGMKHAESDADWDAYLTKAERALTALPEHADSHGDRWEVAYLIGAFKVDERSDLQVDRSVKILELYISELTQAYDARAEGLDAWTEAQTNLKNLRARIRNDRDEPFMPMRPGEPAPPTAPVAAAPVDQPASRPPPEPLVVVGGVLTALGGVALIAGFAFAAEAKNNLDEVTATANACGSTRPCDGYEADRNNWRTSTGLTLGLVLPGLAMIGAGVGVLVVGVRKTKARPRRASVTLTGINVAF